MNNSIIANNTNGNGPSDCTTTGWVSADYAIVGATDGCLIGGLVGSQFGTAANPVAPMLAALATDTTAGLRYRAPLASSTAIDSGEVSSVCNAPYFSGDLPVSTDMLGNPRSADGNDDGIVACDIGAIEVKPDTTPDAFAFSDQIDVAVNTEIASDVITVSGVASLSQASINIDNGEYRINSNDFTAEDGVVNNGDSIDVRHTSSNENSATTNTVLTIGGVSDTFSSITVAAIPDTTPDAFSFTGQTNVALNTTINSNSVTISGLEAAAAIAITGGEYRINGGSFTTIAGVVENSNTVVVRQTSSATYSTSTHAVLTIGGVSDTFSLTTLPNTTPDAFGFTDQSNVALNTLSTSNTVTISGINAAATISVSGGEYRINGGDFNASAGVANNGDVVVVRQASSADFSTTTEAVLTIGGVNDAFSVTTLACSVLPETVLPDTMPDAFSFISQEGIEINTLITSGAFSVSGLEAEAPISISGGEYSINDGEFTSSEGVVNNDDLVVVRYTSSESYETATDAVLSVGGVSFTYRVTTLAEPAAKPSEADAGGSSKSSKGSFGYWLLPLFALLAVRRFRIFR